MIIEKISRKYEYIVTQYYFKYRFGKIGKNSILFKPMQLNNTRSIYIDDNVSIYHYSWLMCLENNSKEAIRIMDYATIGHFVHIIAKHSVTIERNVLIADKVFISDCTHQYKDITAPIIKQDIKELSPVVIGEGSWLGENVCVCGASIGKHCVIGANSVVTSDIPDYCVAAGNPAKVVKRYDFERKEWIKV